MFEALFVVCALESGITTDTCIELTDTWGPYRTEENCQIRLNQIENNPLFNFYIFSQLGFPDYIMPIISECIPDNSV